METIQSRAGLTKVGSEDSLFLTIDSHLRKFSFGQWVIYSIIPRITSGMGLKKGSKMKEENLIS